MEAKGGSRLSPSRSRFCRKSSSPIMSDVALESSRSPRFPMPMSMAAHGADGRARSRSYLQQGRRRPRPRRAIASLMDLLRRHASTASSPSTAARARESQLDARRRPASSPASRSSSRACQGRRDPQLVKVTFPENYQAAEQLAGKAGRVRGHRDRGRRGPRAEFKIDDELAKAVRSGVDLDAS